MSEIKRGTTVRKGVIQKEGWKEEHGKKLRRRTYRKTEIHGEV
jgi:hypothetical protein